MLPVLEGGTPSAEGTLHIPRMNISIPTKTDISAFLEDSRNSVLTSESSNDVLEWALPHYHTSSTTSWTSSTHITFIVLVVFLISPIIICSNALLLVAVYRFKRLRSPSNYFVTSLASVDFGIGILLPPGLYFEFSRPRIPCLLLCLFPYCVFVLLCSVALLSTTAIAVDRCTSLASPLRYNNIITHRSVLRYVAFFWIVSLLLSSTPILYRYSIGAPNENHFLCSFSVAISPGVHIFLFLTLFLPCACLIITSYGYVYFVARSHARAIHNSEMTFRQQQHPCHGPRYGRTLAITIGTFFTTWLPFQMIMFINCVNCDEITVYLSILLLSSAAIDPWIYGYRSTEFRLASFRILEGVSPHLSGALYKPRVRRQSVPFTSCASHGRLGISPNAFTRSVETMYPTFVEIPVTTIALEEMAHV